MTVNAAIPLPAPQDIVPVTFQVTTYWQRRRSEPGLTRLSSERLVASQVLEWVLAELPEDALTVGHDLETDIATIVIDWGKVPDEIRTRPSCDYHRDHPGPVHPKGKPGCGDHRARLNKGEVACWFIRAAERSTSRSGRTGTLTYVVSPGCVRAPWKAAAALEHQNGFFRVTADSTVEPLESAKAALDALSGTPG